MHWGTEGNSSVLKAFRVLVFKPLMLVIKLVKVGLGRKYLKRGYKTSRSFDIYFSYSKISVSTVVVLGWKLLRSDPYCQNVTKKGAMLNKYYTSVIAIDWVFVSPHPADSWVEILMPKVIVLGGEVSGMWFRRVEVSWIVSVTLWIRPQRALLPLPGMRTLRSQPPINQEASSHQTLILDFPNSWTVRNRFHCL